MVPDAAARVERDALAVGQLHRQARAGPERPDVVGRPVPVVAPQPVPADAAVDETRMAGHRGSPAPGRAPSSASGRRLLRKTSAVGQQLLEPAPGRSALAQVEDHAALPPVVLREGRVREVLCRCPSDPKALRIGSPVGGSTLMTSAPQSARRAPADGRRDPDAELHDAQVGQCGEALRFGFRHVAAPPRAPAAARRAARPSSPCRSRSREARPRSRRRAAPCSSPSARGSTR